MVTLIKRIVPLLCCAGTVLTTRSQTTVPGNLDSLAGNFISSLRKNPHEKILVHTDKWFYLAGESIWFKAYSLNAVSDKITVQSKILFVDLVDAHDAVICKQVLNIPEQKMTGKLFLPLSVAEGYYWLRAYTRKILDEDTARMFVQPIYVLNPRMPDPQALRNGDNFSARHNDSPPQINFYPEGGALISGTTSIVAFRAQDHNGKPIDISGFVTDGWDTVSHFSSSFRGMGKFGLDIWKTRKYTAHVKWNGKDLSYELPAISQYASQLSVVGQTANSFRVRVSLGDSFYQRKKMNYLIGISKDSLCFAATGTDMYEIWVPKEDFPMGMATLLLFDEQNRLVSERNIYIDRDNHVVAIKSDKDKYGARERASFDISVTDSLNRPLKAILSVDVTDDNMDRQFGLTTPVEENILASMNLPVAGEQHYSREEWDLIMLAQKEKFKGWKADRRNEIDKINRTYLAEPLLQKVSGTIVDQKNNPKTDEVVTLFTTQENILFLLDTTNKAGKFEFKLPVAFPDSTSLTIQVANKNGLKLDRKILIDDFPFPHPLTPTGMKKKFDASKQVFLREFIANQMDTTKFGKGKEWLREVTIMAAKRKQIFNEKRRLTMFSQIITSDQLEKGGINSLGDALLSSHGVYLKSGFVAVKGGFGFTSSAATEPLLVVDGVPVLLDTNAEDMLGIGSKVLAYLSSMDASTVDFMEIITGPEASVYGLRGANGVISVNTSPLVKHDDAYAIRGLRKFYTMGFVNTPSFTMPDYANKDVRKSSFPDQRSTIYWNGNLVTDEKGRVTGSFYTADAPTIYTLTLMGVTEDGSIVYKTAKLERK